MSLVEPEPFCAICQGTVDLVRAPDGKLECRECREVHPRSGRYTFAEGSRGGRPSIGRGAKGRGDHR